MKNNETIIYQSNEEIYGKFLKTKEYICYKGKLTIYDKIDKSITLEIKNEYNNFALEMIMDSKKSFIGNSVTEVYSKLSKWLYKYDIVFLN